MLKVLKCILVVLAYIHTYFNLSSYYRNSFRGYLWIFNVKQSCLTYFLSNWLLCNGKINAEIIDFHSLFFASLIWWLVGSAGLIVGHPFDTLKVRLTLTYLIRVLARIIISDMYIQEIYGGHFGPPYKYLLTPQNWTSLMDVSL